MEDLKELVYIVNRNKVKKLDVLDPGAKEKTNANRLYHAICDGTVKDDDGAKQLLFPDTETNSAYLNLKGVLRKKLLNTLFFIDAYKEKHSDRARAFYTAYKDYATAQILLAKGGRSVSVRLLRQLLKTARKYEFTELILLTTRALRLHYGTIEHNTNLYRSYNDLWNVHDEINRWENRAEHYYAELLLAYVEQKEDRENLADRAKLYYGELSAEFDRLTSYKYRFYAGLIQLFSYTIVNDYPSTIEIAEEIIQFFSAKPYQANTPILICLHHQLVGYILKEDYERGVAVARRSQGLLVEASFNWFRDLEYHFLLAMHMGEYQDAYKVYREARGHRRFKSMPESIQEIWDLYRAYLHLLVDHGKIKVMAGDKSFSTFRINRFLNLPHHSKDKRGMNITIRIIQTLFYLQKKDYDKAIDGTEALEKYRKRYLGEPETMRANYFVKLLLTIPSADFNARKVQDLAAKPYQKLLATSKASANPFHKIEIIPFEELWKMAVNSLGA